MEFTQLIEKIGIVVTGWPLMIYVLAISLIYTVALRGIQFRYLLTALKATVSPSKTAAHSWWRSFSFSCIY